MTTYIFGSTRTLGAILTHAEYNTLLHVLTQAAEDERAQGGRMLSDMLNTLMIPGDSHGNSGGLDLCSPAVIGMLEQFAAAVPATEDGPGLSEVPGKVAAYVERRKAEEASERDEAFRWLEELVGRKPKLQATRRNETPEEEPEEEEQPEGDVPDGDDEEVIEPEKEL